MSPSKPQQRRARTLYADQHTPGQFRPETVPTVTHQLLTAKIGEFGVARQMRRNDADERFLR
jgi:hypothetical protein